MPKPSFPQTFADGLSVAAKNRGWRAYVPWKIAICVGVATTIAVTLPSTLWGAKARPELISIYSGVLAFSGLVLAIGWGAFSRIYELIGSGPFSKFLRRNGILKYHILFVEMAQFSLVLSCLTSGIGLFSTWLPFTLAADRAILGAAIATTGYAVLKAIESTQAMNEILWEAAEFEEGSSVQP